MESDNVVFPVSTESPEVKILTPLRNVLTTESYLECDFCWQSFESREQLEHHVCEAVGGFDDKTHMCEYCSRTFPTARQLLAHMQTHTSVACPVCALTFPDHQQLELHYAEHQASEEWGPSSSSGGDLTPTPSLDESPQTPSSSQPQFPCPLCGQVFYLFAHLKSHMRTHTEEVFWRCNYCSERFSRTSDYVIHLETHEPLTCQECGHVFEDARALQEHAVSHQVHPPPVPSAAPTPPPVPHQQRRRTAKPHECECGGTNCRKCRARTHQQNYLEEVRARGDTTCPYCQMVLSRREHLKRHIRIVHLKERPYTCTVCLRTFTTQYSLSKHSRIHNNNNNNTANNSQGNSLLRKILNE